VKKIAVIHCNGGHSAKDAFTYHGPQSCAASTIIMGGQKGCSFGCLGLGDCVRACPFDAIRMGDDGVPIVDSRLCTGCGVCIRACPKRLISLWPEKKQVVIACSNRDKGVVARKQCNVACIGCKKCENACPFDAVYVEGYLSVIDSEKCENCGLCARICPTGSILDRAPARPKAYIVAGDCVGCTLCAKACPVDAISGELKEVHEVDQEACIGCGLCFSKCPKDAIRLMGALGMEQHAMSGET
jgi:Na+-translocating ferredoxin:NAD+ oxidoreductase RNF subunit RnfB